MKIHFVHEYLLNPVHPITVNVIGAGGNGSQVLTQLARIDQSLKKLGHLGLHVTCFDDDIVTEANLGRQLFSPADLGVNKAVVLITRLNRFFGTSWDAMPIRYNLKALNRHANITISCVDTIASRILIDECIHDTKTNAEPFEKPYYWMDIGNTQHSGQFVISTVYIQQQPKSKHKTAAILQDLFQLFPGLKKQKEDTNTPSCSLAEALSKQDLFINSTLVQLAMGTLWKMFREGKLDYQGAFLNLQTLKISTINL
jgi:PRTRC genetic system ThiF family protein